mgnify:CR=1 FL=1
MCCCTIKCKHGAALHVFRAVFALGLLSLSVCGSRERLELPRRAVDTDDTAADACMGTHSNCASCTISCCGCTPLYRECTAAWLPACWAEAASSSLNFAASRLQGAGSPSVIAAVMRLSDPVTSMTPVSGGGSYLCKSTRQAARAKCVGKSEQQHAEDPHKPLQHSNLALTISIWDSAWLGRYPLVGPCRELRVSRFKPIRLALLLWDRCQVSLIASCVVPKSQLLHALANFVRVRLLLLRCRFSGF